MDQISLKRGIFEEIVKEDAPLPEVANNIIASYNKAVINADSEIARLNMKLSNTKADTAKSYEKIKAQLVIPQYLRDAEPEATKEMEAQHNAKIEKWNKELQADIVAVMELRVKNAKLNKTKLYEKYKMQIVELAYSVYKSSFPSDMLTVEDFTALIEKHGTTQEPFKHNWFNANALLAYKAISQLHVQPKYQIDKVLAQWQKKGEKPKQAKIEQKKKLEQAKADEIEAAPSTTVKQLVQNEVQEALKKPVGKLNNKVNGLLGAKKRNKEKNDQAGGKESATSAGSKKQPAQDKSQAQPLRRSTRQRKSKSPKRGKSGKGEGSITSASEADFELFKEWTKKKNEMSNKDRS